MTTLDRKTNPEPLTRSQVENLSASQVHQVLGRTMLVDGFDIVYDLKKSKGAYLYDSRTKTNFLDMFSFFASWPVAHNHPKLHESQYLKNLAAAAGVNPANSDIYTVEMAQFVATFERVAMPNEFVHLFFVQGGALAVENGLKTAFDWKVRKNLAAGRGERGSLVVHFKEAFHGRTGYTMSLTNTSDPRKYQYFPRFESWPRVENPKAIFPLDGENLSQTKAAETRSLNQIEQLLAGPQGPDIAAILLEPIQGEGGDNHFRPEFWQALRKLADQYEVLLIADEVQAGFGLTGKFWAHQHYGATPDIVCFGKKSQVCGIMATARVDQVKDNVFSLPSRINSTWGGNLVDMVRSRRFLEIIEEDKLVEAAATQGAKLQQGLRDLQAQFPALISNVRGKGLMCAFDVATPELSDKLRSFAYDQHVLLIGCGTRTIRFRPVLNVSWKDLSKVLNVLKKGCAQLTASSSNAPAAKL